MEDITMKEKPGTSKDAVLDKTPRASATSNSDDTIDLVELFYVLLGRWWIIVIAMIIGGALSFGYSRFFVTPMYESSARIYIVSASNGSVVNISDLQIGTQLTSDYQELLKSRPLLEGVISKLNLDMNYRQLSGMISVTNNSGTRIINLTVTHKDPQMATNIANELANQAIVFLPKIMETDEPNIVEEAILPLGKSSPNITKNTVLGMLLGMVLVCGFFIVKFLLNDTFNDPDDVFRYLGIQPLATIPEVEFDQKRSANKKKSAKGKVS